MHAPEPAPASPRPAAPAPTHRAAPWLLAGLLAVAGTAHFAANRSFQRIIPPALPFPRELVYVSGVAELACAAGLAWRPTRRLAGWATAALFVVVFPANVQMAVAAAGSSTGHRLLTWGRLPLQVPLVWWAVAVARRAPFGLARSARPGR